MKITIPAPTLPQIPRFNKSEQFESNKLNTQNTMKTTESITPVSKRGILVYDGEIEFGLYMSWALGINTRLKAIKLFHDSELMPISNDLRPEDVDGLLSGRFVDNIEKTLIEFSETKDPVLRKYTIDFYREHIDRLEVLIADLKQSFVNNRTIKKDGVTKHLSSQITDLNKLVITPDFQIDVSADALTKIRPLFNFYKDDNDFIELTKACDDIAHAYNRACQILGSDLAMGLSAPMTGIIDLARLIKKTPEGGYVANVVYLSQIK